MKNEAPTSQNWVDRFKATTSIFAILVAVLTALIAIFSSGFEIFSSWSVKDNAVINTKLAEYIATQDEKFQNVISSIKNLEQHISSITNIPKEDTLYIELQKLNNSVSELNSREAKIEAVILESPTKALEIPLLRRDLDNVKEAQKAAIVSVKDSVDRVYDLNKWLLGAMAVSVVTLAAGNLLKPKETKS